MIEIKEDEFKKTITALDAEITNLENIYEQITKKAKKLDGNDDMWKGKAQKALYDYYESVARDFPDTVERIKSFSTYLKNTLDNYVAGENSINKDVDESKENLDVN